jgi:hypothetical protein
MSERTYIYGQLQVAEMLFCKILSGYVMEKKYLVNTAKYLQEMGHEITVSAISATLM